MPSKPFGEASASWSEVVNGLLENARKTGEQIPALNDMLLMLREGAGTVVGEVSRFEVENVDSESPFEGHSEG